MKRLSVLVPIHNRLAVTRAGLTHLLFHINKYSATANPKLFITIVVVDDGSTDGSGAWIESHFPEVELLYGNGNLWWSGAINQASSYAIDILNAEYLLLWNDDIEASDDYFFQLEAILADPQFSEAIIGSKIMDATRRHIVWADSGKFNKFSGRLQMLRNHEKDFIECDWLNGMGTIVPAKAILHQKLWWDAQRFPQYYGDTDFILRAKRKGFQILLFSKLVIYNKTEFTGLHRKAGLRATLKSLTSQRSFFNIGKDLRFYSRHGYFPFAYFGMIRKYGRFFFECLKETLALKRQDGYNKPDISE